MTSSKRVFAIVGVLFLLWLTLSGLFKALPISFGIASCLFVAWIRLRMDRIDGQHHFGKFRPVAAIRYLGWLAVEVIKSNLDVSRRILTPGLPISPTIVRVPAGQKTEIGRALYANSITLTPGTVSIDVTENEIEVHALSREAAEELARGEMGRRVCKIEE